MPFLTFFLSAFALAHASIDPVLLPHLDGMRRSCVEHQDTQGAATAYRITRVAIRVDDDRLWAGAEIEFLRCVQDISGAIGWTPQDFGEPIAYLMDGHEVRVFYRDPELLLLGPSGGIAQSRSLGSAGTQWVEYSLPLSSVLTAKEFRRWTATGEASLDFPLHLRLSSAFSANGAAPVEMGQYAWGGFTVRGTVRR